MRKISILAAALTALVSGEAAAYKTSYNTSSTISYNGITYQYSSSSTCLDGTAALRLYRKWWCPVTSSTTSTSGSTSTSGTSSTSTTTSGTTSTSTTTSSGSTTTSSGTTTTSTTTTSTTTTPTSYSANISWTIPTTRADGTLLSASELSGYEVYYTNDTGSVNVTVPVSGGNTVNTVVSSLTSGNYYFSISAIDTSGLKSALSTVATVSLP